MTSGTVSEISAILIMEKFVLCVVFVAAVSAYKHHPKFPEGSEENRIPLLHKVTCTTANRIERDIIIEQSKCGTPKDVFVNLDSKAAHEQVSPGAVWVKRCVGLCEYDTEGSCVATKTITRHIPIRIYNAKTNKETCATYPVEEHVSCGCCATSPDKCAAPRIYNPPEPEYEVESI